MLSDIKSFFENFLSLDTEQGETTEHRLHIAAAALFVEMSLQDEHFHKEEEKTIKLHLINQLGLAEAEANNLFSLALEEKHQATDYHQFTRLIAEHYSQNQKVQLIESLWEVAYADNRLDKYEEHMVRKISDLIYVSHKDFIQAKHRAEQKSLS